MGFLGDSQSILLLCFQLVGFLHSCPVCDSLGLILGVEVFFSEGHCSGALCAAFRRYVPGCSPGGGCMPRSAGLYQARPGSRPGCPSTSSPRMPGWGRPRQPTPSWSQCGSRSSPCRWSGVRRESLKSKHLIEPTCLGCWSLGQCQSTCRSSSGSKM